jgi:hypothetical protein
MNQPNDPLTKRQTSFQWDGEQLLLITQQGQLFITPDRVMELLELLCDHKEEIFAQAHGLPDWGDDSSTSMALHWPYQLPRLMSRGDQEG